MATQNDYIRTALRVPPGLHAQIHAAAKAHNRTFNSEIVARLQGSFVTGDGANVVVGLTARGNDGRGPESIEKSLAKLPADLYTQYGLHLYNTELKAAQMQLDEALEESSLRHAKLQKLLGNEGGPDGPKMRAGEAVDYVQRRLSVLKNQIIELEQTINNIHFYRKMSGLPELRNVREVSVSVTLR